MRPVITFVIASSGLKYVGLGTEELGWTLCGILLAVALAWLVTKRPWQVPADAGAAQPAEISAAGDLE